MWKLKKNFFLKSAETDIIWKLTNQENLPESFKELFSFYTPGAKETPFREMQG